MTRLPTPGQDDGSWGQILNDFLAIEHNPDGTHKSLVNPDATTTAKGKIKLAGDLAGTADAPTVPSLATKANDVAVVHLAGTETITGVKTFNISPTVPAPTNGSHAATKAYVDATTVSGAPDADATTNGLVRLAGDLGGTAASPTVPGLAAKANDNAVVHLGGSETVTGVKTFTSSPVVPTPTTVGQATTKGYVDGLLTAVPATIRYNSGYAARSTVTSDVTRTVIWIGPSAPTIGGSGAVDGVDVWWKTP